jgi:hypothetical protein
MFHLDSPSRQHTLESLGPGALEHFSETRYDRLRDRIEIYSLVQ